MPLSALLLTLSLVLAVFPAPAQGFQFSDTYNFNPTPAQDSLSAVSDIPDPSSLVTRMAFSLGAVILLIWAALFLFRRLSSNASPGRGASQVTVLDRTYIAPKKAVYIIQVAGRVLAVGVTDAQMNTLTELDSEETLAAYQQTRKNGGLPPFAKLFNNLRGRLSGELPKTEKA